VINNDLPSDLVVNGVFDELLIDLLLSFISHNLLHLLQRVRELIQDILKGLPIILQR